MFNINIPGKPVKRQKAVGFASSADDFLENELDLNRYLVRHPSATYFVRVKSTSMKGAGISNGDLLIVDRSLEPKNNSIVVAFLDGEFIVRKFGDIKTCIEDDFLVWGVVKSVIKILS